MKLPQIEVTVLKQFSEIKGTEIYGLQMVQNCKELHMGSVYVILGRLENKDLVTSRLENETEDETKPRRRLYKITNKGRRALIENLNATPVDNKECNIGLKPT